MLAYFVRDLPELQGVREALGLPLRVVRLAVPLADIEQRLTSGWRDGLREAASSIAACQGAGIEDAVISNDRPIAVVASGVMAFLGWV